MRKEVSSHLHQLMSKNDDIFLLVGDLGFGLFDKIQSDFPERFYNTGAAEQVMSDIAIGLSLANKIPIVYSITPFLLFRCFETWRTYVNHEKLKVILLGSGRNDNYEIDGFSHFAGDDSLLFGRKGILDNFLAFWPVTPGDAKSRLEYAINGDCPTYINLVR